MEPVSDTFATWRAEIEVELAEAQQELAAAEAALAYAEVARNVARAHARKLAAEIGKLTPVVGGGFGGLPARYATIAFALQGRVNDHQRTAASADGPVAAAKGQIAALLERIADLTLAIQQIDTITAPPVDADVDIADADQVEAEAA